MFCENSGESFSRQTQRYANWFKWIDECPLSWASNKIAKIYGVKQIDPIAMLSFNLCQAKHYTLI